MTIYDYNLHDLAESTFQSIQERALLEQSLRDAQPVVAAPEAQPKADRPRGRTMRKIAVGAALVGVVGGALWLGSRLMPERSR